MSIKIPYTIHEFSELYNGHEVPNPTGDENAIYYTFKIGERQFLQTHKPDVDGFIPVYREGTDIIEGHIARTVTENP